MGYHYRERHKGAQPTAQPTTDLDPDNLPGRHAQLDALATERGVVWSADDLTVANKQAELAAALEANPASASPATTTSDDVEGLT